MTGNKKPKSAAIDDGRKPPFFWLGNHLFDMKLSWRALLVYNALAYFGRNPHVCVISHSELAKSLSVSLDTVQRGLAELEKKKLVKIKQRIENGAGRSGRLANQYTLT